MNETLRRALFNARLSEDDVAARLGVDPKTVRRWLEGRVPYPRHRQALSHLVGNDEAELWPEVHAARITRSRPEEVRAVYPHRWAVPHDVWHQLFGSAQREIGVLVYSGLFLAEDANIIQMLATKGTTGVKVRIALGDPKSPHIATRGREEGIGDVMPIKIRNALMLFRSLHHHERVEIRLHQTTLYNSLFFADSDLLVNQHIYGIPAANAPVLHLCNAGNGKMFNSYMVSFNQIWSRSRSLA